MRTERILSKVRYLLARGRVQRAPGQSMVELALTLPLLFLILFGVVDLGRWSMAYVAISNASREGARYGMTKSTDSAGIINAAENEAQGIVTQSSQVDIQCAPAASPQSFSNSYCGGSQQAGDRIKVTVNYTFQFATLYIIGLSNISLSDYTIMVIAK